MLLLLPVGCLPSGSLPKFSTPRGCKVRSVGGRAEGSGEEELGDLGRLVVQEQAAASGGEEMLLVPSCCSSCRESTPRETALSDTLWLLNGRSARRLPFLLLSAVGATNPPARDLRCSAGTSG